MKNSYRYLIALGLATVSLSSCSRANYSFNNKVPAYLGTTTTAAIPTLAEVAPAAPLAVAALAERVVAASPVPLAVASASPRSLAQAVAAPAPEAIAAGTVAPAKPTLAQRLVLKKVMKRLAKAESHRENIAGVAHTTANTGSSLTVAIVGLAALVVGLIIGSGLLITIGSIVLVVGLVLLILSIL